MLEINQIYNADCLEKMKEIDDKSIDIILCDLPFGNSQMQWDIIIPFELIWEQYRRIIKDKGIIALTATQPFASKLIMSALDIFKYELIWQKSKASDFINANYQPMRKHENILIFSKGGASCRSNNKMIYNPQGIILRTQKKIRKGTLGLNRDRKSQQGEYISKGTNYPNSLLQFANEKNTIHPTQKPLSLFEYLIKTYSNEGDIVLDSCSGSGTTAIAAINTNRKYICIEKDEKYYNLSIKRLKKYINPNDFSDLPLFRCLEENRC